VRNKDGTTVVQPFALSESRRGSSGSSKGGSSAPSASHVNGPGTQRPPAATSSGAPARPPPPPAIITAARVPPRRHSLAAPTGVGYTDGAHGVGALEAPPASAQRRGHIPPLLFVDVNITPEVGTHSVCARKARCPRCLLMSTLPLSFARNVCVVWDPCMRWFFFFRLKALCTHSHPMFRFPFLSFSDVHNAELGAHCAVGR
jgi:hypothetical protein